VRGEPGKFLGPAESAGLGNCAISRASASVTLSSVPTMPVSIGVSNPPATIELALIPAPARSREAESDSPMIPALLAE
jgi:hypothetical protein